MDERVGDNDGGPRQLILIMESAQVKPSILFPRRLRPSFSPPPGLHPQFQSSGPPPSLRITFSLSRIDLSTRLQENIDQCRITIRPCVRPITNKTLVNSHLFFFSLSFSIRVFCNDAEGEVEMDSDRTRCLRYMLYLSISRN